MTKEDFIRLAQEATEEQIEEWSQVPDDALTGFCSDRECLNPECQDPRVGVCRSADETYIVAQYTAKDGTFVDKINGQLIPKCSLGHLDFPLFIERYGHTAAMALHVHSVALAADAGDPPLAGPTITKEVNEGLPN